MSVNINMNKLNQYADRFTTQVLRETYGLRTTIGGSDLLKITPVRQVNLGILNRLFDEWRKNALSFRSVYFDFENEEVKHALETFMNAASQHISVKREDLEPLLKQSVRDALTLLYTPEFYFEEKLKSLPDAVYDVVAAAELVKYTHIHQGIAKKLEAKLLETQTNSVSVVRAANWLEELVKDELLRDTKALFEQQFSEIVSLDATDILVGQPERVPATTIKKDEPKSFFDSALSEIENVRTLPAGDKRAEPVEAIISDIVAKSGSPERDSLNNRFKVDMPKDSDDKAYGNVQLKVESIAGSIPLGQRFMFVNQLFSKNSEHFEKAIYELDSVKSYAEAEDLIWHRYASKHAWDVNGEAVSALLSIVKRKFSN
jgi:hypothetical protein